MQQPYATPLDLARYLDPDSADPEVPAKATVLLREASARVRRATAAAHYYTDSDGMPTDEAVQDAMRDAACEQATPWALWNLDPRKGAAQVPRRISSKSLGGASVSYTADAAADAALGVLASAEGISPQAFEILDQAGLISNQVSTTGGYGRDTYLDARPFDPTSGRFIS